MRLSSFLRAHRGLWAVLALGLALRLVPLGVVLANGGNPLIGDEGNYVEAAQGLAHGTGIPDAWLWIRPPGYIALAAAVFRLATDSLVALQLVQIALSLGTIVLTYALVLGVGGWGLGVGDEGSGVRGQGSEGDQGSRGRGQGSGQDQPPTPIPQPPTPNPRALALLAAAILAVQPSLILTTGFFLTETLFLLLITGLVGALVGYYRAATARAAWGWAAVAGGCAGAALLTRASLIPMLLLVGAALLLHRAWPGRVRLGALALFIVAILALLVPWTVRNALHYGRFLPLDTVGYYVIWYDNTDLTPADVRAALAALPNPADRGNYALTQAMQWAAAHPDRFLARSAQRMVDSLAPDDFTQLGYPLRDKYPGRDAWERDAFSFVAWWGWALLFGAALAGWLLAPRTVLWTLTGGVVAVYILTGSLTHNEFRYRYQLFSVLAIYAAYAAWGLGVGGWGLVRKVRGARYEVRGVRGQALGIRSQYKTNPQPPTPNPHQPRTSYLVPRTSYLAALVFLGWLVAVWPTFWPGFSRAVQGETAIAQGQAAWTAHDLPTAAAAYTTAAGLERSNAAVRRALGQVQTAQGQPDAALATWNDALRLEPGDWRTRAILVDALRRQAQPKRAAAIAREVPPTFNAAMLTWAWAGLGATAPLTVTVGWDDVGFVRGFYVGEDDADGGSFRWAGPDAQSSLRLGHPPPGAAHLTLVLRALPGPTGAPPAPVGVSIDGQPLPALPVTAAWASYALPLPAALPPGDLIVTLTAPTRQPSATDPRFLSIALRSATVGP